MDEDKIKFVKYETVGDGYIMSKHPPDLSFPKVWLQDDSADFYKVFRLNSYGSWEEVGIVYKYNFEKSILLDP